MKIVYQKATKIIANYIWEGMTPEAQVLQNVINSALGGSVEDYAIVDAPFLENGYKYVINDDGTVGQEPTLETINRNRLIKLKEKGKASWSDEDRDEILDLLLGT